VEPLVTSSNIAVIIGAVLGTLLAFLILSKLGIMSFYFIGIVFYILYKKYKKDRSDAYTDIYKQEEVVIENNNK
jgi:cell shape-determining protein MreD